MSDEKQYHAALQRIGTALGLPAGSDLTKACVPAIEALRVAAAGKRSVWDVTQAEQNAMNDDQWYAWKAELKATTPPNRALSRILMDHEIAGLVNDLRDIAVEFHSAQQLRERISYRVHDALATIPPPAATSACASLGDVPVIPTIGD